MSETLTIKQLPEAERPYEKCIACGASALSDAELIAVILRTGSSGECAVDLAHRILSQGRDGLLNLVELSFDELCSLRGIGTAKAVSLKCAAELAKRISEARRFENIVLDRPSTIASYYMERLRHEKKEVLIASMYNSRKMLLKDSVITIGTQNASLVSPPDIFREALICHAEYIVLLHNHPSGNPEPSPEDKNVTARMDDCGRMLGICLMDHIIIGDNRYYSFREQKLLS